MVESDEEQLEVLKKWWDENGTSLIVTLVLVVGGSLGYRAWENNVRETGEAASGLYENLLSAVNNIGPQAENDALRQTAVTLAEQLKSEHAGTTYAVFGALHLARLAVESGDLDEAEAQLRWAQDQSLDNQLATLVRTRLARVLLEKQDATAALAQVIRHEPPLGQVASFEEVKGDIMMVLGNREEARAAYQKALDHLEDDISKPLLELKLADIPVSAATESADPMSEGEGAADSSDSEGDA